MGPWRLPAPKLRLVVAGPYLAAYPMAFAFASAGCWHFRENPEDSVFSLDLATDRLGQAGRIPPCPMAASSSGDFHHHPCHTGSPSPSPISIEDRE